MEPRLATPGLSMFSHSAAVALRWVRTPEELLEVFRLRYAINVLEEGRRESSADPAAQLLCDPADAGAHVLGGYQDGRLVATARVNLLASSRVGYYDSLLRMGDAGADHPQHTGLCSRLMVAPHLRGSPLTVRVATACYALCLRHGLRWCYINCTAQLVDLYLRLGFQRYMPPVEHPDYGPMVPLRLPVQDFAHLRASRSPLLRAVGRTGTERDLPCPVDGAAVEHALRLAARERVLTSAA
jgi:predicted GNAT family N-acyltransferase